MHSIFTTATKIVYGRGSLAAIGTELLRPATRALIVTGKGSMRKSGALDRAIALLDESEIKAETFEGVEQDPSFETVDSCAAAARDACADLVVGLGGGSTVDAAKVAAFLARQGIPVREFFEGLPVVAKGLQFVAVPTTAGTGSEVTKNAVLTDRRRGIKSSIRGDCLMADVAIVDPELTLTAPPDVTAHTGMDALTQAIESYVSRGAGALTDALAAGAVAAIGSHLVEAYNDGANIDARDQVMMGSLMAGMALANARLGAVHGLAHPLGVTFNIPHGLVCAILLPHVVRFNLEGDYELAQPTAAKYAAVARMLEEKGRGKHAAARLPELIESMNETLGITQRLGDFGVEEKHLATVAEQSLPSGSLKANPRPASQEELIDILRSAL
jgi:alcohol dehydrogenase class IV